MNYYEALKEIQVASKECRGANLRGADLQFANLCGADLSGANLPEPLLDLLTGWFKSPAS